MRAWTRMSKMYVEVQEKGLCLLRYDPQREHRFPSVFAVGRPVSVQVAKRGACATRPRKT